jgi:hypothetical protein
VSLAAIFTAAKTWDQHNCASTAEQVKKIPPHGYYSAFKKTGSLSFATGMTIKRSLC